MIADNVEFIAALNVTHPATVSTITRTGDKLVFPGGSVRDKLCPLCQM
jgi:cytoplasmic tRNA 2-thiolation protein 2